MLISEKQKQILLFPYSRYDALICDGAIRSGKTTFMMIAFVDWAMRNFNKRNFAVCSKTVGTAIKNIINPYMALKYSNDRYYMTFNRSDNLLTVKDYKGRKNNFYVYGGKDESSFSLIQGITLAGVLLDEVVLMVRSFVEQALARCSITGSKFWFSCNPGHPDHWFNVEWVQKAKEKNALHLHFLLDDNPSLDEHIIRRYESMYSGVFYDRYILGKWVVAEGVVYPCFNKEKHIIDHLSNLLYPQYYVSIDYGTVNPFAAALFAFDGRRAIMIDELYYSGKSSKRIDDEAYYKMLLEFTKGYRIECIIIDPSAASFIETIHKYRQFVVRRADNSVIPGIQRVTKCLNSGILKFYPQCVNTFKEFENYCWDEESINEDVIKDYDHLMDAIRYFVNSVMARYMHGL